LRETADDNIGDAALAPSTKATVNTNPAEHNTIVKRRRKQNPIVTRVIRGCRPSNLLGHGFIVFAHHLGDAAERAHASPANPRAHLLW
jgi:hypothetical protein